MPLKPADDVNERADRDDHGRDLNTVKNTYASVFHVEA